jgi:spermidine synthase
VPRLRAQPTTIATRGELIAERDPLRPSGRLLRQAGMDASYVDLADPARLEFDYMRWMRIVLRAARARRVLHVGGGACALPRALAAESPDGRQEVCEVDPLVLDFARQHFGLRRAPGLRVRCAEGRAFVARQPASSWDAIAIDAFEAAAVPRRLITVEAASEFARVARLVVINVLDDRSTRQVRAVAAAFATAYPQVWTLGAPAGNTIVVGSATALDVDRIAARAAADRAPARLTPPAEIARLAAGAVPPRDEGVEPAGP